jgi:hypothetical protein
MAEVLVTCLALTGALAAIVITVRDLLQRPRTK